MTGSARQSSPRSCTRLFRRADLRIFEESSHSVRVDETSALLGVISGFVVYKRPNPEHHQSLGRRIREQREQRLRHVGWGVAIPLTEHEHGRYGDLRGIVERLTGRPVFVAVFHDAVGGAEDGRILGCANWIAREGGVS